MKTDPKWTPQNVIPFKLSGLAVDGLNRELMAKLSRIANGKGVTLADVMYDCVDEWMTECEAETELEKKIIRFPTRRVKV
jgi:hypothetical protein